MINKIQRREQVVCSCCLGQKVLKVLDTDTKDRPTGGFRFVECRVCDGIGWEVAIHSDES